MSKALIPLKLEPGETYQIFATEIKAAKITKRDGLTCELKVAFTNGAVLYAMLPVAIPVDNTFTLETSAGPATV